MWHKRQAPYREALERLSPLQGNRRRPIITFLGSGVRCGMSLDT
jgi:hypothetical protein